MSLRRLTTVSPLIGCPAKASPSAVQSRRSPVSKSRLSGLSSAPLGSTPLVGTTGATPIDEAVFWARPIEPSSKREASSKRDRSDIRGTSSGGRLNGLSYHLRAEPQPGPRARRWLGFVLCPFRVDLL